MQELLDLTNPRSIVPDQPEWLRTRTIFLARHGSHAYGTSMPTSDLDIKGIAIPPVEYFLGYANRFEQVLSSTPIDLCIYDIRKFMSLAADCNPSIIEVLWTDESDVIFCTWAGQELRKHRHAFLSQKAKHTFSGYATSQLRRIKTHRRWLMHPPTAAPTREEFGLEGRKLMKTEDVLAAESQIRKLVNSWELDLSLLDDAQRIYLREQVGRIVEERTRNTPEEQAAKLLGMETNMIEYLDKERRFNAAAREWEQFHAWKNTRNEARAALEAQYGYDTKNAMHLVRLLRMCREILETGEVLVKRPDAKELLEIRSGRWPYERLIEFAENEDKALTEVMKASKLPRTPDRAKLDKLCLDIISEALTSACF